MHKIISYKSLRVIFVIVLAIIIACIFFVARPKPKRQQIQENPLLVETIKAKSENVKIAIETFGTVKPQETVNLVSEVRGQIVYTNPSFMEGDYVKKGVFLVKIDPRTYSLEVEMKKAQIKQAKAKLKGLAQEIINFNENLKLAKANVALTKTEYLRIQKLHNDKIVAQTTLDQSKQKHLSGLEHLQIIKNKIALISSTKESLKASEDMSYVLLDRAKLDLERTIIKAPFDGFILEKKVDKGQHVNPGNFLGQIYKKGYFEVDAKIPIKDYKWIAPVIAKGRKPKAVIFFGQGQDKTKWIGYVSRVKAKMDEKTRTIPLVIEIAENNNFKQYSPYTLRPGMFVTVKIFGEKLDNIFVLPRHLINMNDTVNLYKNGKLQIQHVNVIRRFKDNLYINKGLSNNDLVIITPLSGLSEGAKLRLNS